MSQTPLVSIIITCCNQASFIASAIQSALSQHYADKEVIVVDDGSRDASRSIIEKYPMIKKFFTDHPHTAAYARNLGMRHAHGKFAICLDGDDLLDPSYLKSTVPAMERSPHINVVYTDRIVSEGKKRSVWRFRPFCRDQLLRFNYIPSPALFRWKKAIESGMQNESLRILEDYDFWLKMTRNAYAYYIPHPLYTYRVHHSNKSRRDSPAFRTRVSQELAARYSKHGPVLIRLNGHTAVYEIIEGSRRLIASRSAFESRGYSWQKIIPVDPGLFNIYPRGPDIY